MTERAKDERDSVCVCTPKGGIFVAFQQVFGGVRGDSAVFRFNVEYLCFGSGSVYLRKGIIVAFKEIVRRVGGDSRVFRFRIDYSGLGSGAVHSREALSSRLRRSFGDLRATLGGSGLNLSLCV